MERAQLKIVRERIEHESRKFIQVIYGPRQVGKTTLVQQLLEKIKSPSHYATADAVTSGQATWIAQQWETIRLKLQTTQAHQAVLVLDEIQKIGNWSEYIKSEWDQDTRQKRPIKVILLGSSRVLLQQGLTESLAGRFETIYLPHWSYGEMKKLHHFTLDQFIWFGGYPGAADLIEDENRWKEYMRTSIMETSISRDILMLTRVDKPALIRQLFEIGCAYSGQILSFNKILGQLHDAGNTTTLSQYLTLLDNAGLLSGIEKYSPDIIRQRSSSPKFQVHNTGLMSALESASFADVRKSTGKWGRWTESAVGAHLLNQSLVYPFELFYWRHRNDEIDFVVKGKKKVIGIEVKTTPTGYTSGMDAFNKLFHPDKVFMVGGSGIPLNEFLQTEVIDMLS